MKKIRASGSDFFCVWISVQVFLKTRLESFLDDFPLSHKFLSIRGQFIV